MNDVLYSSVKCRSPKNLESNISYSESNLCPLGWQPIMTWQNNESNARINFKMRVVMNRPLENDWALDTPLPDTCTLPKLNASCRGSWKHSWHRSCKVSTRRVQRIATIRDYKFIQIQLYTYLCLWTPKGYCQLDQLGEKVALADLAGHCGTTLRIHRKEKQPASLSFPRRISIIHGKKSCNQSCPVLLQAKPEQITFQWTWNLSRDHCLTFISYHIQYVILSSYHSCEKTGPWHNHM